MFCAQCGRSCAVSSAARLRRPLTTHPPHATRHAMPYITHCIIYYSCLLVVHHRILVLCISQVTYNKALAHQFVIMIKHAAVVRAASPACSVHHTTPLPAERAGSPRYVVHPLRLTCRHAVVLVLTTHTHCLAYESWPRTPRRNRFITILSFQFLPAP